MAPISFSFVWQIWYQSGTRFWRQ